MNAMREGEGTDVSSKEGVTRMVYAYSKRKGRTAIAKLVKRTYTTENRS